MTRNWCLLIECTSQCEWNEFSGFSGFSGCTSGETAVGRASACPRRTATACLAVHVNIALAPAYLAIRLDIAHHASADQADGHRCA